MNSITAKRTTNNPHTPSALLLWVWRLSLAVLILLVLGLVWLGALGSLFEPGSELSYNLGLIGVLLMLSLLLYPLRKRIRALDRLGQMGSWFRYHMFIGIAGPVLILLHSNFRAGSMNSRIALYAMLLVMLSGVIGRFVYRRVHRGIYGKEQTLAELEAEFTSRQESIGSVFSLQPDIEQRLSEFHRQAFAELNSMPQRLWRFMTLRYNGQRLSRSIVCDIRKRLESVARSRSWSDEHIASRCDAAKRLVDDYVYSIIRLAQLSSWAKLLSFWHIVHIPFIYLLVISVIAHVIAVHLY